jgi:NAD-dependent deacetylase
MDWKNRVDDVLEQLRPGGARVVTLTGAGISAESGIPTFRGPEGYWRVGSRNYRPTELATHAAFSRMPDEVWAWYLYRRGVCRGAQPNPAHQALTRIDSALSERHLLITQNVDGLHLRAGSPADRTYQIHGNIDTMRCRAGCTVDIYPIPETVDVDWEQGREVGDAELAMLVCPRCGGPARPHVLWFDESYDEVHFRFESSIAAATSADLLIVVGTTGGTNLPLQVGALAARQGAAMIVVNPEPNPFTEFAASVENGVFLEGTAGEFVPPVIDRIIARDRSGR